MSEHDYSFERDDLALRLLLNLTVQADAGREGKGSKKGARDESGRIPSYIIGGDVRCFVGEIAQRCMKRRRWSDTSASREGRCSGRNMSQPSSLAHSGHSIQQGGGK